MGMFSYVENYKYDDCGNPTHFKSPVQNMWWTRGKLLYKYKRSGGDITYSYDGQGRLFKKTGETGTREYYYDGDKLLAEELIDKKTLRFFYDVEGIAGFKEGALALYVYHKDAQGNVVTLTRHGNIVAHYIYDAWGKCKVIDKDGKEITDWDHAAVLNPIRWKSQYYDTESGLYRMENNRWYDPARGRYISAASPETLLTNTDAVFALNLYALAAVNPLAVMFAAFTILPSLGFYYNGEYKTWWQEWGFLVMIFVGVVATAIAMTTAFFTCGGSIAALGALMKIGLLTAIGTVTTLAVGGTVAGMQSALTGHGFWQGFGQHVQDNTLDAFAMSFAIAAVTVSVSTAAKAIQGKLCFAAGTLVLTSEGNKKIEDVEIGDMVLSFDEKTGQSGWKPVIQLFRDVSSFATSVEIQADDGTVDKLVSTPGHKYYLPFNEGCRDANERLEHAGYVELSDKWVSAKDLKAGDKLVLARADSLTEKPKYGIVVDVKTEECEEFTTYNFEVEDFHTYYVGKNGICTHNANCGAQGKVFDSADDAYNAARKDLGLNPGEKPMDVVNQYYNNGKGVWTNQSVEVYSGNRAIVNHSMGHYFPDGGVMQAHYNVGTWSYARDKLLSTGFHYFY